MRTFKLETRPTLGERVYTSEGPRVIYRIEQESRHARVGVLYLCTADEAQASREARKCLFTEADPYRAWGFEVAEKDEEECPSCRVDDNLCRDCGEDHGELGPESVLQRYGCG